MNKPNPFLTKIVTNGRMRDFRRAPFHVRRGNWTLFLSSRVILRVMFVAMGVAAATLAYLSITR